MQIAYIGTKEIKADNIAQTGLIWRRGEIHEVADEKKALKLLEHKTIWVDATGKKPEEIEHLMTPQISAVAPAPRVHVVPEGNATYWDPYIVVVPAEVYEKLNSKEFEAYFMTPGDADLFSTWKAEHTREQSPQKTGPRRQEKETKAGLDARPAKAA